MTKVLYFKGKPNKRLLFTYTLPYIDTVLPVIDGLTHYAAQIFATKQEINWFAATPKSSLDRCLAEHFQYFPIFFFVYFWLKKQKYLGVVWQHQLRGVGYSNPRNIRVLADARGTRCLSKAETGTGERFAPNSKVASNQSRRIKEWRLPGLVHAHNRWVQRIS